jgi:hypothetical protein
MGDFEEALANFNDTLLYLRGNKYIDYEQLGLKFKLYSCEVLFNRGLCYMYLRQIDQGMQDLSFAANEKAVSDHDVIDEAIRERAEVSLPNAPTSFSHGQGYTVFSIPVGVVYRPNEAKVKNLQAKDYLGKAKLVAAVRSSNAFTGFAGAEMKKMNNPEAAKDDRPEASISFAASNLVKSDLKSRYRQQSEPPGPNRDMFPPTPPPDGDRISASSSANGGNAPGMLTRAESMRVGGPRQQLRPLDIPATNFDRGMRLSPGGLLRTQSERSPRLPARSRTQLDRSAGARNSPTGLTRMSSDRRPSAASSRGAGGASAATGGSPWDNSAPIDYDDLYDMYGRRASGRSRGAGAPRGDFISEEEDYASNDEPDFEMMSRGAGRRGSRRKRRSAPDVHKIRVKVHAEDTRYVMVGTAVEFADFIAQIRQKFGMRQNFKVKIKDEGDMITMADQDDLEMAISQAKTDARKERADMGKMEVRARRPSICNC